MAPNGFRMSSLPGHVLIPPNQYALATIAEYPPSEIAENMLLLLYGLFGLERIQCWFKAVCVTTIYFQYFDFILPDSKIHGANMGPIWVLSAPYGSHVGPMDFAIWAWITFTETHEIKVSFRLD